MHHHSTALNRAVVND